MLKFIEINPIETAEACVIWLHGLGADGNDFVPVVEMLGLPHIHFILPHAPHLKVTLNNGYEMPAWYDIFSLAPDSPQDESGIRHTQAAIETLIKQVTEKGIPTNKIALAGFSQGGAIALQTALRHDATLAGILALSTYLPLKKTLAAEKTLANQNTPIFMAHGTFDDVINIETAKSSKNILLEEGYKVKWKSYPMAHSVNEQEIDDIKLFLTHILPKSN